MVSRAIGSLVGAFWLLVGCGSVDDAPADRKSGDGTSTKGRRPSISLKS